MLLCELMLAFRGSADLAIEGVFPFLQLGLLGGRARLGGGRMLRLLLPLRARPGRFTPIPLDGRPRGILLDLCQGSHRELPPRTAHGVHEARALTSVQKITSENTTHDCRKRTGSMCARTRYMVALFAWFQSLPKQAVSPGRPPHEHSGRAPLRCAAHPFPAHSMPSPADTS